ncbi:MAG: DNA polymerase III subunit delta [bacterium]|nr:DNA polymerase III subunit delta [bacterium]
MIFFLHGDDTYRSREKLRELKEKFLRDVDPSGANLVTIDGTTASANEIWGAVATQSFLVRKRMVVVERIGAQKSTAAREEVAAFLGKVPEDVILVFWEEKGWNPSSERRAKPVRKTKKVAGAATKRSDPLFVKLLEGKYAQEFVPLDGVALTRWVVDVAETLGASIAPDATRTLVAIVGSDLWRMRHELEKLALTATNFSPSRREGEREGEGKREGAITTALIRDLVVAVPQEDVFGFVDAIGRGDRAAAMRILRDLEAARVDPHYLLAMIHRQLRLLVMAADLLERGTPPSQLAVELHVHPFVAQKLSQQAHAVSLATLRALYPNLLELDRKLKSSRVPWEALMELFCLEATAVR